MITRQEYMREPASLEAFRRYYGDIIAATGGPEAFRRLLPVSVEKVRAALDAGDLHLNTIPLHLWDSRAQGLRGVTRVALLERGDSWSLGSGVCILKEAARLLANG